MYGIFYFGFIGWAFILIIISWIRKKEKNQNVDNKRSIYVLVGYLSFLAPMGLTLVIDTSTIAAIESIMCKYAILLAITLLIFSFQYDRIPNNETKKEEKKD